MNTEKEPLQQTGLVNEQLVDLIQKHLHFHGGTDDKWWLQSSIKNYLEHGKVSGSFYQALEKIAEEYAFIQKHLYLIKLKTVEAKEAADAGEKQRQEHSDTSNE
jgi:hypothetical protein